MAVLMHKLLIFRFVSQHCLYASHYFYFTELLNWIMVSSAIWKKTRTSEFFKDYQNCTSPKDECYLRSMKNSRVRVFSKLHEKSCYYFVIIMTKLCRIVAYACVTCKIIYSLLIVNIFITTKHLSERPKYNNVF